jgi:acyl-CoA oxidase
MTSSVDPRAIQAVLDGRWAQVRQDVREQLGTADYAPVYGETTAQARARVTALTTRLAATGRVGLGFPVEYGGSDDAGGSVVSVEMLAFADLSLMVKAGVQWGLFGGAVQALGSS